VLAGITGSGRALVERCTELLNEEVFSQIAPSGSDAVELVSGLRALRRESGDFD
jgi:hypothetical protein